jgi:hypothetical protein
VILLSLWDGIWGDMSWIYVSILLDKLLPDIFLEVKTIPTQAFEFYSSLKLLQ